MYINPEMGLTGTPRMMDGRIRECDGSVFNEIKAGAVHLREIMAVYLYQWAFLSSTALSSVVCVLRQEASGTRATRPGLFECGLDGYQETIVIDDDTLERSRVFFSRLPERDRGDTERR